MLKVGGVILSFFQLVLAVSFKLIPDAINKGLKVSKVFLKENLEVRLCNQSGALMPLLMLGPSGIDTAIKKCGGKSSIIHSCSVEGFEIILRLLTKVVVIYVRFSGISLQGFSFK